MTLGHYVNKESFIHKLDPRNKFLLLVVLLVSIFINNSYLGSLFLILLAFVLYKIAKLSIKTMFTSLKPMYLMLLFLLLINVFVYKDYSGSEYDFVVFNLGSFSFHLISITKTLFIAIRLFLLVSFSTLFTSTTNPLDITIALDDIFGFLKVFKINVHVFSMIISIALRFIPTILEDTNRIMISQASRGVDFKNGKLKDKMVAISSLIIPLMISSFSRSYQLADAMEARNYNPDGKRVRYRVYKWHLKDSIMLGLSLLLLGAFIFTSCYFKDPTLNEMTLVFLGLNHG